MNSITNKPHASGYLALALRQRLINRFPLMRSVESENDLEHASVVSLLAMMAGHLANNRGKNVNVQRMMGHGLVHDQPEVLCQDISSVIKNLTPEMRKAYGDIESAAEADLIATIPDEIRDIMRSYFEVDGYEYALTKACDKYAAYIKIVQECAANNTIEYGDALRKQTKKVEELCEEFEEIEAIHHYFRDGLTLSVDALLGKDTD